VPVYVDLSAVFGEQGRRAVDISRAHEVMDMTGEAPGTLHHWYRSLDGRWWASAISSINTSAKTLRSIMAYTLSVTFPPPLVVMVPVQDQRASVPASPAP
jgi:hypothetical protein